MFKIAAFQGAPAVNWLERYNQIHAVLKRAEDGQVDILCFPEGFLTGYFDEKEKSNETSLSIRDKIFRDFVQSTSCYTLTFIIGFTEKDGDSIYDSAAVIEKGKLLGVQRKHYQYHSFCSQGTEYYLFKRKGVLFAVNICLDANYFEPARICALQGASLLFVPSCNKVLVSHSLRERPLYYSNLVARAHENRLWVVSADWIWKNDSTYVCPGHTVVYDTDGREMARSKEGEEDTLLISIPFSQLSIQKGVRVKGSAVLHETLFSLVRDSKNRML